MVINLAKGKGVTDDPKKKKKWKNCTLERQHRLIHCAKSEWLLWAKKKELRKNPSGRSNHVDIQQRCSPLDKKLKEIKGVNEFGSVDPRELCLVPDLVIPPNFKMPKLGGYDGTKCPENHLATYCNKTEGHARNEKLLIYVFFDSLAGAAAQWYSDWRGVKFAHEGTSSEHFWRDTNAC